MLKSSFLSEVILRRIRDCDKGAAPAYGSIRHTSAYVSLRQPMRLLGLLELGKSGVSIRQHTSAYAPAGVGQAGRAAAEATVTRGAAAEATVDTGNNG